MARNLNAVLPHKKSLDQAAIMKLASPADMKESPLEIPQNFRLDPDKPITDKSASFIWSSVNEGPWRMQGHYMGCKIQYWKSEEGQSEIHEHSIYFREKPNCWKNEAGSTSVSGRKKRSLIGNCTSHTYIDISSYISSDDDDINCNDNDDDNKITSKALTSHNDSESFPSSKTTKTTQPPLLHPRHNIPSSTHQRRIKICNPEKFQNRNFPKNRKRRQESSPTTHGHVYNLWPYSNITAQIVVMNVKYSGRPSAQVHFTTKEGKPGPLESFTAVGRGINYLMLMWAAPKEKNGILLGYTLTYTSFKEITDATDQLHRLEISGENNTLITLKNLSPDYKYSLTVCAKTVRAEAYGKFSPPSAPEIILNLLNDDRLLNVTWYTPSRGHTSRTIVGTTYIVNYRKAGESKWTQSKELANKGWHIISGLEGDVTYEIKLTSRNGEKEGDPESYSNIKRIRIGRREDISNQPSFRVWYGDSNVVKIGLEHTKIEAIQSYRVEYRYWGSNNWISTAPHTSLQIITLDDLTSGGRYEVRVVVTMNTSVEANVATNMATNTAINAETNLQTLISQSKLVAVGRDGVQAPFSFPSKSNHSHSNISKLLIISYLIIWTLDAFFQPNNYFKLSQNFGLS
ncbi:hypothetical protein HELRODRAFT_188726 [Helobdella robusta]|uniref:Fibronectin type-III domain-containing protein n=1 Tax=Helobdella robusta TaxID=6412 RepID=T1FQA8_HELRO|nr:hypothetical protein HELRODRAFT_188726 [Helobdella robusta]ESO02502.1 hypothetical protein HELRODRAFT_188726 [Helobdella robusta]